MVAKISRTLRTINPWHFLWIIVLGTQVITFILNSLQSLLRWGFISHELIEIGIIDAFICSLIAAPFVIYHLKAANEKLKHEISERISSESALRESEERYRDLFENTTDLIQMLHPNGHFLYVNRAWRETFGYGEDKLVTLTIYDIIAHDCIAHCSDIFQQALSEGAVPKFESVFLAGDGRRITVEGSVRCKYDGGKPVSIQCILRDITAQKKMETELFRVQKLESLGVLAGGIAHDFNNALTGIQGYISLAEMKFGKEEPEWFEEIEKAAIHAKGLTQQLLTFSKGGEPVRKILSLDTLIKNHARLALRGSNAAIDFHFAGDLWSIYADEGQIVQVFNNLLINAKQSMPSGGSIRITAENMLIGTDEGFPLESGNYISVLVKDSGTGIPAENIHKIFDPYFSTKKDGHGLGLAVTYSIIKNHNGYISVQSEIGIGTTFSVYLPASKEQPLRSFTEKEEHVHGKGRILIMDDDKTIQKVAGAMLEKIGYSVAIAHDGSEALMLYSKEKDSSNPFDAVIIDLTVPGGMGGRETIEKLLEIDPAVNAIVSSGYYTDPIMANFTEYGFKAVLPKPYEINQLSKGLQEIIRKS